MKIRHLLCPKILNGFLWMFVANAIGSASPSFGQQLREYSFEGSFQSACFSRAGKRFAVAGPQRSIEMLDVRTMARLGRFDGAEGFNDALSFSPDDKLFAATILYSKTEAE